MQRATPRLQQRRPATSAGVKTEITSRRTALEALSTEPSTMTNVICIVKGRSIQRPR